VTRDRQRCGREGEARAAVFLAARGFTILARNVRAPAGEIDLVALDGDTVVFCEIRTRRSRGQGGALESVTPAKQRQVVRVAEWLLATQPALAQRAIDAVLPIEHVTLFRQNYTHEDNPARYR